MKTSMKMLLPLHRPVALVAIVGLLLPMLPAAGATLLEENFDGLAPSLRPAIDESFPDHILGWTHTPPPGWSINSANMDLSAGVTEWRGWSFSTMDFWPRTDAQGREGFTLAEGVFAVAESDEYDDKDGPPAFDSTLISPVLRVSAGKTVYVEWDNMVRPVNFEYVCQLLASINGGPDMVVMDYRGRDRSNTQELVRIAPPETGADWNLVIKWRFKAKNGWFWGIDNVRVTDAPPAPPLPMKPLAGPEDWPTYRGDTRRAAIAPSAPKLPLSETWVHTPVHPPSPAWPAPAREDISHRVRELSPTHVFDRAFHVAVVGDHLYYGSSTDDAVHCLDTATGALVWSFITEGPVRFAPTATKARIYAGSDDGCVYCLSAKDGSLLWKHRPAPDQRLPGNGRMISRWPIRSGVAVTDGVVYFTAGLFPVEGVFLCALDAQSGKSLWKEEIQVSSQGYLMVSPTGIFLPTGRSAPASFIRKNGKPLGRFKDVGSCFGLVLEDMLVQGPNEKGKIHISAPRTRESIVSAPGLSLVADGPTVYILKKEALVAFDRKRYLELSEAIRVIESIDRNERTEEQNANLITLMKERASCEKWDVPCSAPYELIKAGDKLFAGGDNAVFAFDSGDGKLLWTGDCAGKAYGLAVSHGRLFVSTDRGSIHCFSPPINSSPPVMRQSDEGVFSKLDDDYMARCAEASKRILKTCDSKVGYCLVLGCGTGQLAAEIAQRSEFTVVGIESNAEVAAQARLRLQRTGLYGARVSIHTGAAASLPYPDYFANLVVSEETLINGCVPSTPAAEIVRVLHPEDGTVCLIGADALALSTWGKGCFSDWDVADAMIVARRSPLEGVGEWTHTYGEPGNTACSGDLHVSAPFRIQWYGQPGPRRMADRHFRNVPPLYKDGRLFVPGNEVIFALDAYNGNILWESNIEHFLRLGVFLDSSNMTVDEKALYVVTEDVCQVLDTNTGKSKQSFKIPGEVDSEREWGYIAHTGELLLGTTRRKGVTYGTLKRDANLVKEPLWYPNMKVAVSETVFALDRSDGRLQWSYHGGSVVDSTLTVADDRLCFLESHSATALADETGRLTMRALTQDGEQYLVALDLATGKAVSKKRIDVRDLQQPSYLNYKDGVLLLSGGRLVGGEHIMSSGQRAREELKGGETIHYAYIAFDVHTGEELWRKSHATELPADGGHGEYNRHPTIIGETAYCWPYAYNLKTGVKQEDWKFDRHGHGCGGISASANALFWRGNSPWTWDLRPGGGPSEVTKATRPGCWINMIPAGGLLLIPEASSGCTCGYSIQTSIALAPQRTANKPALTN